MTQPSVSVVIPVYRVEEYLCRCVDSVLRQTLRDLEIILVDDGSDDACPAMCDDYALRDSRVTVVHQENRGLSEARNAGLALARGDYIYFLDSDDYIREDAMETLLRLARADDADIVLFDALVVGEDDNPLTDKKNAGAFKRRTEYHGIYGGGEMLRFLIRNHDYTSIVQLLFLKRRFIKENALTFYPGILHEDELFTFVALLRAHRVMHTPERLFFRRIRANSIMTSAFTHRNASSLCRVVTEILRECGTLPEARLHREYALRVAVLLDSAADKYIPLDENGRNRVRQELCDAFARVRGTAWIKRYGVFDAALPEAYNRAGRVIFYGAGQKCAQLLNHIQGANVRMPDTIWDMAAREIGTVSGISAAPPDFASLRDCGDCVMIICLADPNAAESVRQQCAEYGFNRAYGWWEACNISLSHLLSTQ